MTTTENANMTETTTTTIKITPERANENVYAIIEGQRGAGGKTLRLFTSATACLTAFFDGGYEGRAHFKKVS